MLGKPFKKFFNSYNFCWVLKISPVDVKIFRNITLIQNHFCFCLQSSYHCLKSVQIRSFFWCVFSCIRIEYRDLLRKSPYSVRIQEDMDQEKLRITLRIQSKYKIKLTRKNFIFGHFSRTFYTSVNKWTSIHRHKLKYSMQII